MAIGVFITFRILDLADLTAEGAFPLGAATTTIMIIRGINPIFATLGGFVAGMLAGAVSGFMHTKNEDTSTLNRDYYLNRALFS